MSRSVFSITTADGQHQREEGQHVDSEAEHQEPEKRSDHADRDGEHRDQGGSPALEKEEDHQSHQRHGDEQRLHHLVNGGGHERSGVERDLVVYAFGEAVRQLAHAPDHGFLGCQRIGSRPQVQQHWSDWRAVQPSGQVIVSRPKDHLADVANPDQ
jgi:hypothetical protein